MNSFNRYKRHQVVLDCSNDPGLTEQSHIPDCDMHRIMRQYEQTGLISHTARYKGTYQNYADAPTFQQAMDTVAAAQQMFETVPANIRAKFGNDPKLFLEFIQDKNNYQAIADLGLDNSHLPAPPPPPDPEPAPAPAPAP